MTTESHPIDELKRNGTQQTPESHIHMPHDKLSTVLRTASILTFPSRDLVLSPPTCSEHMHERASGKMLKYQW